MGIGAVYPSTAPGLHYPPGNSILQHRAASRPAAVLRKLAAKGRRSSTGRGRHQHPHCSAARSESDHDTQSLHHTTNAVWGNRPAQYRAGEPLHEKPCLRRNSRPPQRSTTWSPLHVGGHRVPDVIAAVNRSRPWRIDTRFRHHQLGQRFHGSRQQVSGPPHSRIWALC